MAYYTLHPDTALNFTLNRLAQTVPPEEIRAVAKRIDSLEACIKELQSAAETAEYEGRLVDAARYLQGAEFYMTQGTPGKIECYERSIDLMDSGLPEMAKQRDNVPYLSGQLPVIRVLAVGEEKGVILIHSGFDALIEEMYPMLAPLCAAGYSVYAFEGPGQGAALRSHGLHMPYNWEKPVSAILDHYRIDSCTLIGMSLGGYLAPRAAAFESRIKRVVAWGAMFDFFAVFRQRLGAVRFKMLENLLNCGFDGIVNNVVNSARKREGVLDWAVSHGMHVSGTATPFEYFQWVRSLNLRECAHRIEQDVLLIMGAEDHLVPADQLYVQASSMTHARSVTSVMLTAQDQAAQHCQVGNTELAIRQILSWLDLLSERNSHSKGRSASKATSFGQSAA